MDYRYGSRTVFQIEYHFVWVTKYRYKVLTGEIAARVRELVRETCEAFEIKIVVSKDHVHILASAPFSAQMKCTYGRSPSIQIRRGRRSWKTC
jgi:putative transposase